MIDELVAVDAAGLGDDALRARLIELEAARRRLDAAEAETLAVWESRQGWTADGAATGAAWLRHWTGVSGATARDRLRVARSLRSMPGTAAAFRSGGLSWEKVRLLTGASTVDRDIRGG